MMQALERWRLPLQYHIDIKHCPMADVIPFRRVHTLSTRGPDLWLNAER